MRGAANAAGAGRDNQSRLRVLVAQNHLEAAEQFRLRPGVGDNAVFDFDAHVEIAFDATNRRDVESLNCGAHGGCPVFKKGCA